MSREIKVPKRACKTCHLTKNRLISEEDALLEEKRCLNSGEMMLCTDKEFSFIEPETLVCRTFQARHAKTELFQGTTLKLIVPEAK